MLNETVKEKEAKIEILPNGPRLGNEVIEAIDVSKVMMTDCCMKI